MGNAPTAGGQHAATAGEVPRVDGDAIMPELSWARLKTDLHLGLRRGAWYRVIRETDSQVILDVDHQPLTVLREYLEFVSVRPHCTHRASLLHPVVEARCSKCGGTFLVDWSAPYLAGHDGSNL